VDEIIVEEALAQLREMWPGYSINVQTHYSTVVSGVSWTTQVPYGFTTVGFRAESPGALIAKVRAWKEENGG